MELRNCQTFPRLLFLLLHFSLHWLPLLSFYALRRFLFTRFSFIFSFLLFCFSPLASSLPFRCFVSLPFPVLSLKLKISWDVKLVFHRVPLVFKKKSAKDCTECNSFLFRATLRFSTRWPFLTTVSISPRSDAIRSKD